MYCCKKSLVIQAVTCSFLFTINKYFNQVKTGGGELSRLKSQLCHFKDSILMQLNNIWPLYVNMNREYNCKVSSKILSDYIKMCKIRRTRDDFLAEPYRLHHEFSGHHPMARRDAKFENGFKGMRGWRGNVGDAIV